MERMVSGAETARLSILKAPDVKRSVKSFFYPGRVFARDNSETQHFFVTQILNKFENRFEIAYSATAYNFAFDKFIQRFYKLTRYNSIFHSSLNRLYSYERYASPFFVYGGLMTDYRIDFIHFHNSEFANITAPLSAFSSVRHKLIRQLYRHLRFLTFFYTAKLLIGPDFFRFKLKYFYFSYNRSLRSGRFLDLMAFSLKSYYLLPFVGNFYSIRSVQFFTRANTKGLKGHKSLHIRPLYKMPQLDLYSIANQFFWGITFFCGFYYVIAFYFVPAIFTILYARNYYTSGSGEVNSFVISYIFVSQTVIGLSYEEVLKSCLSTIDTSAQSSLITTFLLSDIFNAELSDVFEEDYYVDEE